MINSSLRIGISDITASDAFPTTVVQQYQLIAIDAAYLITVLVIRIPIVAVSDAPTTIGINQWRLIGIEIQFASTTVIDIPIAGTSLNADITPWIV